MIVCVTDQLAQSKRPRLAVLTQPGCVATGTAGSVANSRAPAPP